MLISKQIQIPLMGGLGNQLFQLAAGLFINQELNRNVRFSSSWFEQILESQGTTSRNLLIHDLIHKSEILENSEFRRILFRVSVKYRKEYLLEESSPADDTLENVGPRTRAVSGYFQKSKYVNAVATELLQRFGSVRDFKVIVPARLEPRIAVHLRFGDYQTNAQTRKFHGLSDPGYYINAVEELHKQTGHKHVLIVSDDLEAAFAVFRKTTNSMNLELLPSLGTSELDDLALLSHSEGIVTSNSTFSWWAAWLASTVQEAKVIAPYPWFASPSPTDQLLPLQSWTKINRRIS